MVLNRRRDAGSVPDTFLLDEPDAVAPVLQPVLDLEHNAVAGYEALARVSSAFPPWTATQMFRWARRTGRTTELDWVCRCAAFRTALACGLRPPMPILVNAEPSALDSGAPAAVLDDLRMARRELRVVVELTERELADNPVQLFRVVDSMRALGWEIAVDDVGAEPISLALLPLLDPDVIKLDRAVIVDPTAAEHARTALAVAAEANRTGAAVVAEGVETLEQRETARALGARYAQGFFWGQPGRAVRPDLPTAPLPLPRQARLLRRGLSGPSVAAVHRRLLNERELDAAVQVLLAVAGADPAAAVIASWPRAARADGWRLHLAGCVRRVAFVGSASNEEGSCELMALSPSLAVALVARPAYREGRWEVDVLHGRSQVIELGQRLVRGVTHHGAVLSHQPIVTLQRQSRHSGGNSPTSTPARPTVTA